MRTESLAVLQEEVRPDAKQVDQAQVGQVGQVGPVVLRRVKQSMATA